MNAQLFNPDDHGRDGHGRNVGRPPDRPRDPKPLLSVEETAWLLGQSRSSLYRSIERGDLPLPVFRISGRYRIPRRAVELLLEGVAVNRHEVTDRLPPAG